MFFSLISGGPHCMQVSFRPGDCDVIHFIVISTEGRNLYAELYSYVKIPHMRSE